MIMNKSEVKQYRSSRQRQRILEYLTSSYEHPSALEVYKALKPEMPSLSLGNLYRNLHILVDQKLVLKISSGGSSEDRFDAHTDTHVHFTCTSCGKIHDLDLATEAMAALRGIESSGFAITETQIHLSGICPACKA